MATVIVELVQTTGVNFPAGTVLSGYGFSVDGNPPQIVPPTNVQKTDANGNQYMVLAESTFYDVSAGANTAYVAALGADGVALAPAIAAAFLVPEPDVTIAVPAAITVAVQ